ncbi:Aste57867_22185 [Aphanomyces stellatus]|uniref:Aste57867_22185 protein n=1 Tax=Aphanomyces stellatus TaxID=120398 RepID=A0A485LJH7_9STRA|nr:hypothetical protein As57867_022116 [Aphanomyces stellatus]VFT98852.1 Aste57867_22185 [Aphanomyces stellatus]
MSVDQALAALGLSPGDPEEVFEIHSREGVGAFGRVFRASYRNTRKEAALKVIPISLKPGQHGEDIETVRREIQFLRDCDHVNVVAFYGAYYKDGALWIAMEYCGGGSVGDISRQRKLCEQEISVIMRGALEGLAHLHSKKKIHRDIKGGNILLTADGHVKIADFGVSAQLRDTFSRRGTFVGTPYWMSPEMIQDCNYDYKADIWSLGITAIELADQRPPLYDEHPMRVLIQIPRNPAPRLSQPRDWSPHFSHFLEYCLTKAPTERPTALECLAHPFVACWRDIPRVVPGGILRNGKSSNGPVDGLDVPPPRGVPALAVVNEATIESTHSTVDEFVDARQDNVGTASAASACPVDDNDYVDDVPMPTADEVSVQPLNEDDDGGDDDDDYSNSGDGNDYSGEYDEAVVAVLDASSLSFPGDDHMDDSVVMLDGDTRSSVDDEVVIQSSVDEVVSADAPFMPPPPVDTTQPEMEPVVQPDVKPFPVAISAPSSPMAASTVADDDATAVPPATAFIGTPFDVSHHVCVKYNSFDARYEGVPASFEQLHQQFGIPLAQMRCSSRRTDDFVPSLLRMLRRELGDAGIAAKYIYRSSPDHGEIQAARAAINAGTFDRAAKRGDPYLVSSLIKLWFRELPEPLLASCAPGAIAGLAQLATATEASPESSPLPLSPDSEITTADKATLDAAVEALVAPLTAQARQIFEWLLEHWCDVVEKRATNMMSAHSLAIVWVPNLIEMTTKSPQDASRLSNQVATALQVCMEWWQLDHHVLPIRESASSALRDIILPPSSSFLGSPHNSSSAARLAKSNNSSSASLTSSTGDTQRLFSVREPLVSVLQAEMDRLVVREKRSFVDCQRIVLNLLHVHARSKPERDYADKLLQHPSAKPTRPLSLVDCGRFIDAVLDLAAFAAFDARQQDVARQLSQLCLRYPQLTLTPDLATLRPLVLPPTRRPPM